MKKISPKLGFRGIYIYIYIYIYILNKKGVQGYMLTEDIRVGEIENCYTNRLSRVTEFQCFNGDRSKNISFRSTDRTLISLAI